MTQADTTVRIKVPRTKCQAPRERGRHSNVKALISVGTTVAVPILTASVVILMGECRGLWLCPFSQELFSPWVLHVIKSNRTFGTATLHHAASQHRPLTLRYTIHFTTTKLNKQMDDTKGINWDYIFILFFNTFLAGDLIVICWDGCWQRSASSSIVTDYSCQDTIPVPHENTKYCRNNTCRFTSTNH